MTRLFSYKMTHDSGFAPNPYGKTLTLATCKWQMRKHKREGDWIAGWTSNTLSGEEVGQEKLIYLMRIGQKMPLDKYYQHKDFQDKKPIKGSKNRKKRQGDNIYYKENDDWEQRANDNHPKGHLCEDTRGENVLIADEFYYFGKPALEIPRSCRPIVPEGPAGHGRWTHDQELAEAFIAYIQKRPQGIHGTPHDWDEIACDVTASCRKRVCKEKEKRRLVGKCKPKLGGC